MIKKNQLFVLLIIMLISVNVFAQKAAVTVVEKTEQSLTLHYQMTEISVRNIKTEIGTFSVLTMDNYYPSTEIGKPSLPLQVSMIEIPVCKQLSWQLQAADSSVINATDLGINFPLYPSQPPYPKSDKEQHPTIMNKELYQSNHFFGFDPVRIEQNGILRDVNLATIYFSPVRYNPVSQQFIVYTSYTISINYEDIDLPATLDIKQRFGNQNMLSLKSSLLNTIEWLRKDLHSTQTPVRYLILAHSSFRGMLDQFIEWKKKLGFLVDIHYTDDADFSPLNTGTIANFMEAQYNNATITNPAPTYVLLVGDVEQIPTFLMGSDQHATDLYYFTWTGNDNLPDCYYGRFSATNATQLETILGKTLMYEQTSMPDISYLSKALLIAGSDSYWSPTHANGQINYEFDNYVNSNLYSTVYKYMYNSTPQAAEIRSHLGEGLGFANYTAHCNASGWYDPAFNTSHIANMNNQNKYGLMIGNCCQSSSFHLAECFGEALLRTPNKGAVAYIGGSDYTYWNEDFYWAVGFRNNINATPAYQANNLGCMDRLFHNHGEAFSEWATTTGGIVFAGNLAVQNSTSSSDSKTYYWEVYNVLGDPSLMPWLGIPTQANVEPVWGIQVGDVSLSVNADPYSYIAISENNTVIASTFADENGDAVLSFPPISSDSQYDLSVTSQNHLPYFQRLEFLNTDEALVYCRKISKHAEEQPVFAEDSRSFDIQLSNIGNQSANQVYVKLNTVSNDVQLLQDSLYIGNVAAKESLWSLDAFDVKINSQATDQQAIPFIFTTFFNDTSVIRSVNVKIDLPKYKRIATTIENLSGNTQILSGNRLRITMKDKNVGHAAAKKIQMALLSYYSKATIENMEVVHSTLMAEEESTSVFYLNIDESVERGTIIPLFYRIKENERIVYDTIYITVGNEIEDFENQNFTTFEWQNNDSYPWIISASDPHSGSYCAKSANNLPNNRYSSFSITINVPIDNELSFFYKVSSERDYDFLYIMIDGQTVDSYSGSISTWTEAHFALSAGTHNIEFRYQKDGSISSGSDCAWIDDIVLPIGTLAPVDDYKDYPLQINDYRFDKISIYPNPAQNKLSVQVPCVADLLLIYDIRGRIVQQHKIDGIFANIDISSLYSGVYIIKAFYQKKGIATAKLVIND